MKPSAQPGSTDGWFKAIPIGNRQVLVVGDEEAYWQHRDRQLEERSRKFKQVCDEFVAVVEKEMIAPAQRARRLPARDRDFALYKLKWSDRRMVDVLLRRHESRPRGRERRAVCVRPRARAAAGRGRTRAGPGEPPGDTEPPGLGRFFATASLEGVRA